MSRRFMSMLEWEIIGEYCKAGTALVEDRLLGDEVLSGAGGRQYDLEKVVALGSI